MKHKTIKVSGKDVFVIEERFSTVTEDWNEYRTTSGVQIRVKLSLNRVYLVVDKDGKPLFNGEHPSVVINSSNIVIADPVNENVLECKD